MAVLNGPESLALAIRRGERFVEAQYHGGFESLIRKTMQEDPRLLALVEGIQGTVKRDASVIGLLRGATFSLQIDYYRDRPASEDDVIVDDGTWTPSAYVDGLGGELPDVCYIVTTDPNALWTRCGADLKALQRKVDGLLGLNNEYTGTPFLKDYKRVKLTFDYGVPRDQFIRMTDAAMTAARMIVTSKFGNATVPKFIKVFLALSWIQLNCSYDEVTAKCVKEDRLSDIRNTASMLAYGPLVAHLGMCGGIASAYKMLMDCLGIPCEIVRGELGSSSDRGPHAWNIVELGGRRYHVDATFGIDFAGVCAQAFMKTDAQMVGTHTWDDSVVEHANGTYYDMDYIFDYIEDHEAELLAAGVDAGILTPRLLV